MKKFKMIENGILVALCESETLPQGTEEISQSDYDFIMEIIHNKTEDTETTIYKLDANTLEYIPFDKEIEVAE